MGNQKKSFVLYFDNYLMIRRLPVPQRGYLLDALFCYADRVRRDTSCTVDEVLRLFPQMEPQTQSTFSFMASNLRRDAMRWLHQREVRTQRREQREARPIQGPGEAVSLPPEAERGRRAAEDLRRVVEQIRRDDAQARENKPAPAGWQTEERDREREAWESRDNQDLRRMYDAIHRRTPTENSVERGPGVV